MWHMVSDEFIITYINSLLVTPTVQHSCEFKIVWNIYPSLQFSFNFLLIFFFQQWREGMKYAASYECSNQSGVSH